MAKSVQFEIDTDGGRLTVASGALFLGEQTPITFTGYTKGEGNTLRLTVFGRDGVTPLADNHTSEATLDLRADILRKQFGGCRYTEGNPPSWKWTNENHGAMSFDASVIELDSSGAIVGGVLSRGRVSITWAPYVFDAATGTPATLKGDAGADGEDGEKGDPLTWDDLTEEQKASLKGETGATGATGAQGPQGPQGVQGDKGADSTVPGPANVLSIGTVESGTTASATITGTSPSQTLNLVLPKGDKGDTGVSASATVTQTLTGATITCQTGSQPATTATVSNGADGAQGAPASVVQVLAPDETGTNKWHYMYARYVDGKWVLSLDQNASARDASYIVPQGGSAGQVLTKSSASDYDVAWTSSSGDVTGATMNDAPVTKTSGVLQLGTVLTDSTAFDAAGAAATVQSNLTSHTGNGDIHVTATQKTEWSAKQAALPTTGSASDTYAINVSGNAATATTAAACTGNAATATTAAACTGNAATATNATNDANGNAIASTYATKSGDLGGYKIDVVSSSSSATSSDTIYFITGS